MPVSAALDTDQVKTDVENVVEDVTNIFDAVIDIIDAVHQLVGGILSIFDKECPFCGVVHGDIQWKETYTVNFDAGCSDATNMPDSQSVGNNEYAAVPPEPQRTGYLFLGWYKDYNDEKPFDFFADKINSNITLYAKWISVDESYDMSETGDPDKDGLSNAEERKYGTDPLNYDTDGDGVSDKKEIELGTDPLVPQKTFVVTATSDAEGDSVTPYVNISLSGEQVETVVVEPVKDNLLFPENMPGYIGHAYNFSVVGTFQSATISFEFDASLLKNENFDPTIYYYNEETQTLEPLVTTVNGNVASASVEHFSTYILLDRTIFENAFTWQDTFSTSASYSKAEILLLIDDSGSLGGDYDYNSSTGTFTGGRDPEHLRLEVAKTFIDNANSNAKLGIIKFDGVVDNISNGLVECSNDGKNTLKSYLKFTYVSSGSYNISGIFDSRGYTYMYTAIDEAMDKFSNDNETLKAIVVFTDGEAHDSSKHSQVIAKANKNDVKIYTVGLGTTTSYFNNNLKPLATATEGAFYSATAATELFGIYDQIKERIDIETDSDNDGIPDYYEDNMICFNGVKLQLDKYNPDTDGDGKLDGEEVVLKKEYSADKTKVLVTGKIISNPCKAETSSETEKVLNNLRNNLPSKYSSKKEVLLTMAEVLLNENFEPSFVAGVLGNIYCEGSVGLFESSNYRDQNRKPQYLKYMDEYYNYRSVYSGKYIYNGISLSGLKSVMDSIKNDGYSRGKFGLGCVQWTGTRTYTLVTLYLNVAGSSDTITKDQAQQAEALMISTELKSGYKYVYNSWKSSCGSNTNSADAAYNAGSVVCKKYEVPADYNNKAVQRGNIAKDIYNAMV